MHDNGCWESGIMKLLRILGVVATLSPTLVQGVEGDFSSASLLLRPDREGEGAADPIQASTGNPYLRLPDEAPMVQVVELDGADHLTLSFSSYATADDASVMVEFSNDLSSWTAGYLLSSSEEENGTVEETWGSATPMEGRMYARVRVKTGFPYLDWNPEPFEFIAGSSQKFIDYENGDDGNPGTRESPWKHHPWDPEATGSAAAATGIHTYVFKRGVVYRGTLNADESGNPGNPIRLTSDPTWGTGEAVLAGSMRVDVPWTPYEASVGLPFPEDSQNKIWMAELDEDIDPKLCWLVNGREITQLPIAREPDWEVTNPDNPMTEWWIWTDEKSSGRIRFQSTRERAGTEGFSVGETIWISDGDETPQEIEENRANSTIVITDISSSYLTVSWDESDNLGGLNGKIITNGVVYRNADSHLQNQEKALIDDVHLVEPDPDFYDDALIRAEHYSYAGYGHPSRVSSYSPANHSVTLSYWIPSLLNSDREPQTNCRYYFEDKPQFLDSPGEFYYDRITDRLYVRLPGDQDPNTAHIELARNHLIINIEDQDHIEISGLALRFENIDDWFDYNQDNAAVRIMGDVSNIKISHCSFEHVIKALSYYPLRDSDVGDYIELSDSEILHTDQNAIAMSHGCGGMWGYNVFPNGDPLGHLKNVKILRNNIYDIGHRPAPNEACHAVQVKGGELVEIAYNIIDRTYGSGISACNSKFAAATPKLRAWVAPLVRVLVHHNKVTNTLLQTHDWGGIASWGVGPAYIYSNISGNAVGHRGYDWIEPPAAGGNFNDVFSPNYGCAYYYDHMFKSYSFNNIAWGKNNDIDDEYWASAAYNETFALLNHWFNNTAYNVAVGRAKTGRPGFDCRYLGNLYLDVGYSFNYYAPAANFMDFSTLGFANNLYHGDVEHFSLGGGSTKFTTLDSWMNYLNPGGTPTSLASQSETILDELNVMDAAGHDFRLLPGAEGVDGGVKVFVPWGLYKVAGEWPFYRNNQDPTRIMDEHLYANEEWRYDTMFHEILRHDLVASNIDEDDYEVGPLEDWVPGVLRFNGEDQYCSIIDSQTKSDYPWTTPDRSGVLREGFNPGSRRITLDVGTENFLIEIYFKTASSQTGGTLVSKGDKQQGYHLVIDELGRAQLQLAFNAEEQYQATALATVNDNQWHHLIAEVDRAAQLTRIYLDGLQMQLYEEGSLETFASLTNTYDFTVGKLAGKGSIETRTLTFFDFENLDTVEGLEVRNAPEATASLVDDVPSEGGDQAVRVEVPSATNFFSVPVPIGEDLPLDLSDADYISFWIKSDVNSQCNFEVHDSVGGASAFEFPLTGDGQWTQISAPLASFTEPPWSGGPVDWSTVDELRITAFGGSYSNVYLVFDMIEAKGQTQESGNGSGYFHGSIDFLRLSKGTLEDAETTIEELYEWQFNGPFLKDFFGNAPKGAGRDVGAIEQDIRN